MKEKQRSLMEQYEHVYAILQRYQSFIHHGFEFGGNPHRGQGRVLSILKLQPQISQKELGYLLDMRNQSLGELLSKLEKKGYITRTPSEEDRRTMNITLTDAGREAAEKTKEKQSTADQMFSCLSQEDQMKLEELLIQLEHGLMEQTEKIFEQYPGDGKVKKHRRPPHPARGPHFFGGLNGSPHHPSNGFPPFHGFDHDRFEDEEDTEKE